MDVARMGGVCLLNALLIFILYTQEKPSRLGTAYINVVHTV